MLANVGRIYFRKISDTIRKDGSPFISLDILDSENGDILGQVDIRRDEKYSSDPYYLRIEFNVLNPKMIEPITLEKEELLEEIVIGTFIWFHCDARGRGVIPSYYEPYFVNHKYDENSNVQNTIVGKINSILSEYCRKVDPNDDIWLLCKESIGKLLKFLAEKNKKYID